MGVLLPLWSQYLKKPPPSATHSLPTKGENINLAWHPQNNYLCVGNKYDLLSFIDMRMHSNKSNVNPGIVQSHSFKCEVNEFSWDTTGQVFALTTGNGTVRTYDFETMIGLPVEADLTVGDLKPAYWCVDRKSE